MRFLHKIAGLIISDRVRCLAIKETVLLGIQEEQTIEMVRAPCNYLQQLTRAVSGTPYWTEGRPRTHWNDYISQLAWEYLGDC